MGYYDEALSLCRSLGEIADLFVFFILDQDHYYDWMTADRATRLRSYSAGKIRDKILAAGKLPLPIDQTQYRELCELATHVIPNTKPNWFNGTGSVGPLVQDSGREKCLAFLSQISPYIAMMGATMTGNTKAFDAVRALADP